MFIITSHQEIRAHGDKYEPIRMPKIKKTTNIKCWNRLRTTEILVCLIRMQIDIKLLWTII